MSDADKIRLGVDIDARCTCDRCEGRTRETYSMRGNCSNCGSGPFSVLYRKGDSVRDVDCPNCGCYHTVRAYSQKALAAVPEEDG